jgi:nucleoside-diphosphate-sugar epimerase
VLRSGHLYGPGSFFSTGGGYAEQVREGKFPVVGRGESVLSFTHSADAASAIVAVLETDAAGCSTLSMTVRSR